MKGERDREKKEREMEGQRERESVGGRKGREEGMKEGGCENEGTK